MSRDILDAPAENSAAHSAAYAPLRRVPIAKIAAATETAAAASHSSGGTAKRSEKTMPTASGTATAAIGIIFKRLRMLSHENPIL